MESIPENGVQRFGDIIIEQHNEDDSSMLHLELEDSGDTTIHEINMNQSVQIGIQETVPDLETSASQIVNKIYFFLLNLIYLNYILKYFYFRIILLQYQIL